MLTSPAHLACSSRLLTSPAPAVVARSAVVARPTVVARSAAVVCCPCAAQLAIRTRWRSHPCKPRPSQTSGSPAHPPPPAPSDASCARRISEIVGPRCRLFAAAAPRPSWIRRSCLVRRLLACSTTARWSSTWRFVIMRLDCCFLFAFRVFCLPKAAALVLRPTFSFSFFLYVFFFLLRIFVTNRNANRTTAVRPAAPKHN